MPREEAQRGCGPARHPAGPVTLLGLLKDLDDAPALGGAQRPGLHEANPVTDATSVGLIKSVVLGRTANDLAVQPVLDAVFNGDDDGLVHLVADDQALANLTVPTHLLIGTGGTGLGLAHLASSATVTMPSSRSRITV